MNLVDRWQKKYLWNLERFENSNIFRSWPLDAITGFIDIDLVRDPMSTICFKYIFGPSDIYIRFYSTEENRQKSRFRLSSKYATFGYKPHAQHMTNALWKEAITSMCHFEYRVTRRRLLLSNLICKLFKNTRSFFLSSNQY